LKKSIKHNKSLHNARPVSEGGDRFKVAGLFAGVGGIELGLGRAGHESSLLCEIDPAARAVLEERFDPSMVFSAGEIPGDVRALKTLPDDVSVVTAGFPCQDLSQVGRAKGIRGRHSGLVAEVFRLVERKRPRWVLLENVPFMLQLAKGKALKVITDELERLGYSWVYRVVDTRSFGLPQRRRRVYLLASTEDDPRDVLLADDAGPQVEPSKSEWSGVACGFYWTEGNRGLGWTHDAVPTLKAGSGFGIPSAPAIVLPTGHDGERLGTPSISDAERLQGFDAGWTKAAASVDQDSCRWRLMGNSVTVDAAEWVGRRLLSPGKFDGAEDLPMGAARWPVSAYNVGDGPMWATQVSEWPLVPTARSLVAFLGDPLRPLSPRATKGFYQRFKASTLSKPTGFLDIVSRHFEAVSGDS